MLDVLLPILICYEEQTHHSQSEKKMFFPYFLMALLILVYLYEP
jgi:uncharacterized membrane protein YadS